jgi:hypothetical protein
VIKLTDLWNAEASNGEAGDEVALELAEAVALAPVNHREDLLQAEPDLLGPRLVLVLPQRVVSEQRLLDGVRELGEDVLPRRDADLVCMMNLVAVHVAVRPCPAADVGRLRRRQTQFAAWLVLPVMQAGNHDEITPAACMGVQKVQFIYQSILSVSAGKGNTFVNKSTDKHTTSYMHGATKVLFI